jgi:hypothetical protein
LSTSNTELDMESHLIITAALRRYLSDQTGIWTIEDACVSGRVVSNRTSVPPDAITVRYLVEHPDQGWSLAARAVWRSGKLMQPVAVHVVIERYWSEDDDLEAARVKANGWLRSLPL